MKVKLRDLTLEQYEKWKETNCPAYDCENKLSCHKCVFNGVDCAINLASCWIYHKDMFSDKLLDQEIEIDCESILTKEEKEHLSSVVKFFMTTHTIKNICKIKAFGEEVIMFDLLDYGAYSIESFEKGTRFLGMKINTPYTLEELGL